MMGIVCGEEEGVCKLLAYVVGLCIFPLLDTGG